MENSSLNTIPVVKAPFVCSCPRMARSACVGEPSYGEVDGKAYCVLHYPGKKDEARFRNAIKRKLAKHNFNFRGVWFHETQRFSRVEFTGPANFVLAVFNDRVRFRKARFAAAAYFNSATFNRGANFSQVKFAEGVNFTDTTFVDPADFQYVHFNGEVDFTGAKFQSSVKFYGATFKTQVRFAAARELANNINSLDLQFARIEKPELVYFHSLYTTPSWFVNVDVRKFDFVNVHWNCPPVTDETVSLAARNVSSPHRMLAITYRRLAVNAEENHRYDEASNFRFKAMEAGSLERTQGFELRVLTWFYRQASGYGEQVWRALLVLLSILVISAALYTQVGFARWEPEIAGEADLTTVTRDEVGAPLKPSRALAYSAAVMTFQHPDPRPATTAAKAIVVTETILGPLQATLLALAIRRKFMR
jgi:hypothetical protein